MTIQIKDIIRDKLPPVIKDQFDGVNVVLALNSDNIYDEENLYIPKWTVVNTAYYNRFPERFEGWIELEQVEPPLELLKKAYGK